MATRFLEDPRDRDLFVTFLMKQDLPLAVNITPGGKRTTRQNRLGRQWFNDINEQMPGESAEHWRGYSKLHFGVPILRNDDEDFRRVYDERVRPLDYETKLALMQVPLDLPVTRLMSVKQHTAYLEAIQRHFAGEGVRLTDPEMFGLEDMRRAA